jgi:TetR/AcrR family transcriptional repressor of mexJK operon
LASSASKRRRTAGKAVALRRRGGRPTKDEAARLGLRIVDAATELFFTLGYGATTIEAVARRARISKRTFYHRFENKSVLLRAVVHRTIERLRPPADVPLVQGANLQEILHRLAALILRAALSAPAIALHRLIVAESRRFPTLATVVASQGASEEAIRLIAGVLEREADAGKIALDNPTFAARQFLQMVIAVPQNRAMGLGTPMTSAEVDAWSRDVVNLFVNGCRGWECTAARRPLPSRVAGGPVARAFPSGRGKQMFRIEIEDGRGIWTDVRGADGAILTFAREDEARAKLAELYPVMVQMEKYGDPKRTRVIRILDDEDDWPKKPARG